MLKKLSIVLLYLFLVFTLFRVEAANDIPTTKTVATPQALLQLGVTKAQMTWLDNKQVISILFSHKLSQDTDYNNFLTVTENGISFKGQWQLSEDRNVLYLKNIKPKNKYEVFIRPGLKAANGLKLLSPKHYSITTEHAAPKLEFIDEGKIFSTTNDPTLQFTSINIGQQKIAVYKLQKSKQNILLKKLQQSPEISIWDSRDLIEFSDLIHEENIESNQVDDQQVTQQVNWFSPAKKPIAGIYFIDVKAKTNQGDSIRQVSYFIVSDFRLYLDRPSTSTSTSASLAVYSVSSAMANLLPQVKLSLITQNDIQKTKTNKQGVVQIPEKSSATVSWILAQHEQQSVLKRVPPLKHVYRDLSSDTAKIFLDKRIFKAGEPLAFSVIARDKNNKAIMDKVLRLVLRDADNNIVSERSMTTPELGNVSGFFQLPKIINKHSSGQNAWHLSVYLGKQAKEAISSTEFHVFESSYKNATLNFTNQSSIFNHKEKTKFIVSGFIDKDRAAISASVVMKQNIKWLRHPSTVYKSYHFGIPSDGTLQGEHIIQTLTLDDKGNAKFVLPKIKNKLNSVLDLTLQGELMQEGYPIVKQSKELIYWPAKTMIGVRTLNWGSEDIAFGVSIELININPQDEQLAAQDVEVKIHQLSGKIRWKYTKEAGWIKEESDHSDLIEKRTLSLEAGKSETIDLALDAGNYRVSITNPETGLLTVDDFTVGKRMGDELQPDQLKLSLNKASYQSTDTAILSIESALAGEAIIQIAADSNVYYSHKITLAKGQTQIKVPLESLWHQQKNIPTDLAINIKAFHNESGHNFSSSGNAKLTMAQAKLALDVVLNLAEKTLNIHSNQYKNTYAIIVLGDTLHDTTAVTQTLYFDKKGDAVMNNQSGKIVINQYDVADLYFVDHVNENLHLNWIMKHRTSDLKQ